MSDRGIIFLVEDNPDDVDLTRRAFRKSNVTNEVIVARNGQEALDYLFAQGDQIGTSLNALPEVVLLDLNLPKIDGLEVLRQIRAHERTRRLPVVVLTSSNEERDVLSSYDLGANSFIRKPIDYKQFAEAAGQLGRYWLVLNQPPPPHAA
jgi:two-component system response regulator